MNLKGTQTEKNLWLAFSGESQTLTKYVLYEKKAAKEGLDDISALFKLIADQEEAHAAGLFYYLEGVKDTLTNLKRSADGEYYESNNLYQEYERVAKEEGFQEIADYFSQLSLKEKEHEQKFLEAIRKLQETKQAQQAAEKKGTAPGTDQ